MKKFVQVLSVATVILLSFTFQSCEKLKESVFPSFENDDLEVEFTIPIAPDAIEDTIHLTSIHFNVDSIIKSFTGGMFTITDVNAITVKDVEWTLENSDDQNNFQNLEKASVLFHSSSNHTPAEVAAVPSIPYSSTNVLNLGGISSSNIKNYFTGSDLYLQLAVKIKQPTTKELQSRVRLTIQVD
jgi:hypothetical protein